MERRIFYTHNLVYLMTGIPMQGMSIGDIIITEYGAYIYEGTHYTHISYPYPEALEEAIRTRADCVFGSDDVSLIDILLEEGE